MRIDPEALEEIRAALADSARVDHRRISVQLEDDEVVLRGSVATPEESTVAAMIAERIVPSVFNGLQVDPALREGTDEPTPAERIRLDEDEVLLDEVDPLAGVNHGAGSGMVADTQRALEENEPLDAPDEPYLAVPGDERSDGQPPNPLHADDPDVDPLEGSETPAAADLDREDLEWAAQGGGSLPALDPTAVPPPDEPTPGPDIVEPLGLAPTEGEEHQGMPEPLPGTGNGPGAVGEEILGGGPLGGVPAGPTGALGIDTAEDDPTRGASGGSMTDLGGERGPGNQGDDEERERPIRDEPG